MNTFLFDFDGTLVESMPTYVSSIYRILDENQVPYEKDVIKEITPLGMSAVADRFIEMGLNQSKEEIIGLMAKYMLDAYLYHIPEKKNVSSVLRELKKRGARLFVLTASPHITLDACLKRLGLYDLFEKVWSCDDFYTTKADPRIYQMAAEQMGERVENVLFLDDNPEADKTAKKAGMKVCGVYDDSSAEYRKEMEEICDYYITDFSQLLNLEI